MTFPRYYLKIDVYVGYILVTFNTMSSRAYMSMSFFLLGIAIRVKPEKIIFHNLSSIFTGTDPITDRIDRYTSRRGSGTN